MHPRLESLERAHVAVLEDGQVFFWADRKDLSVSYLSDDPTLVIWVDPINTMREIGLALVDESGTMRANARRDRRYERE